MTERPIDPTIAPSAGSIAGLNAKINNLSRKVDQLASRRGVGPNSIGNAQLSPGSVQAATILAGTIQAGHISTGAVTANAINTNAINSDHIATHALDADDIFVSQLSALSANMGEILAGTITGGTFQTNSPGLNPRVALDPNGVYAYRADGTQSFWIDATTGKVMTIAGVGGFNTAPNSSFEDPIAPLGNWTAIGTLASSSTQAKHGTLSARATSTGASNTGLHLDAASAPKATVGKTYTASIWVYPTVARTFTLTIQFLDASNAQTGFTPTTLAATANSWQRLTVSADAPASTAKVKLLSYFAASAASEVAYFDAAQIEEGQIVTAYVPKADEILNEAVQAGHIAPLSISTGHLQALSVDAGKIAAASIDATKIAASAITAKHIQTIGVDMIQNPSFEFDLDGWALAGGSVSATRTLDATCPDGDYAMVLSGTGGGWCHKALPVQPGQQYYVSLYLKHSNGNGDHYVTMFERTTYPTGGYVTVALQTSSTNLAAAVANSTITGWTKKEFVYTVPAGVYWVSFSPQQNSTGTLSVDQVRMNSANGGIITSGTFRGATFETAATNPRVAFDSTGFFAADSGGNKVVNVTTTGLNILPGTSVTPPDERKIQWKTSGGIVAAEIRGADYTDTDTRASLEVVANPARSRNIGTASLVGLGAAASTYAQLRTRWEGSAIVEAIARDAAGPEYAKKLIDGSGQSDFLMKSRQHAFRAYHTHASGSYGDGNTIVCANQVYDHNANNYNTTTGVFTAPEAGVYHFDASVYGNFVMTAGTYWQASLIASTSSRVIYGNLWIGDGANFPLTSLSGDFDLASGETVTLRIHTSSGSGKAIYSTGQATFFSGHMVRPTA